MSHHRGSWHDDDDDYYNHGNRRKKQARPPARQHNERGAWHKVHHAPGVSLSLKHKYSVHVYLIFHRFDNMDAGNFVATMSFRTMSNDYGGMKKMDFSPATEEADPLFDLNGGNLKGVTVTKREFVCKIGWVKRIEAKQEVYLRVGKCLPYAIRPETMNDEEWEEKRVKGPKCRTEWVLKAIRGLKKEKLWEELPMEDFQARHEEVREVVRKERAMIGSRPNPSFETTHASRLDEIMYDVGVSLYRKHEEKPKKTPERHRGRWYHAGF
ncbi:hypothetical protein EAE96_007436 [Botrytis aclada]|nr:hypothetical protein EAE96_007436 [Botrytis aclada]